MGLIDTIFDAVVNFINFVRGVIKTIITKILNFMQHVVNYFRGLMLAPKKDVPFVAQGEEFKQMIKDAPVKNCGIFEAVYNEETDEIEHAEYIAADQLDAKTREILGNEKLVVLQ